MFSRTCPYCKEKIKKRAVVCRYCHRDLEPPSQSGSYPPWGVFAGFVGMAVGVALALGLGYYRERLRWRDGEETPFPDIEQDTKHTS